MTKARELAELADELTVDASGNATFAGDVSAANLSTTGNITVSGTVDGRDVAADGLVIDGLGTASTQDVGTSANNVVQLNGSAQLPAVDGSQLTGIQAGAGYFQGENGNTGDTTNGKGDIFRTHESTLNTNVTIASGDNSLAAGPITVASGVTLTVSGNLSIV